MSKFNVKEFKKRGDINFNNFKRVVDIDAEIKKRERLIALDDEIVKRQKQSKLDVWNIDVREAVQANTRRIRDF